MPRTAPTHRESRRGRTTARGSDARHSSIEHVPTWEKRTQSCVDIGLLAVMFLAPLFMGGRYEVGRLVYIGAVCFTTVSWLIYQCLHRNPRYRWSGVEPLLVLGLLVILLQLTPMPASWLRLLSPEIEELLPLWTVTSSEGISLGSWNYLSLTPQATRAGLATYLAHGMLFVVVVQRIENIDDAKRLMRWLAMAAAAMATLGLAQLLFGNGKFFWIYEHPSRDTYGVVKGTFQNQNHFAHFVVLGLGPLIWWISTLKPQRRASGFSTGRPRFAARDHVGILLGIALGIMVLAVLLTFSRGGFLAAGAALAICLILYVRQGLLGKRALIAVAGSGLLAGASLLIHGYEPLAARLATLTRAESMEQVSSGRKHLWEAHLEAIPRFWFSGTGVGSHADAYKTFLKEDFGVEFTHGENGYLHLLFEAGLPALLLAMASLLLAMGWCLSVIRATGSRDASAMSAALFAGLGASALHSIGDFIWYIPACFSLTLITAACACRLCQFATASAATLSKDATLSVPDSRWSLRGSFVAWFGCDRPLPFPRSAWAATALGVIVAAITMVSSRVGPAQAAMCWDNYFRLARESRQPRPAEDASEAVPVEVLARHLEATLIRNPSHARAHLRLAAMYLRMFDSVQQSSANPMSLAQIRDAALASQFPSRDALDGWLSAVMGENRHLLDKAAEHARDAICLCPLQGEGYVYLAELSFLHTMASNSKHEYIAQALRVRPHSGAVLLAAGGEAALTGDVDEAFRLWKVAFHADDERQLQLIEMLALQIPPAMFLDRLEPDRTGLSRLYKFYRQQSLDEAARQIGVPYAEALENQADDQQGVRAAHILVSASSVHEFLGDHGQASDCLRQAIHFAPHEYQTHHSLARQLLATRDYEAAVAELRWCLARKPDDVHLQDQLANASRMRVASSDSEFVPK